MIAGLAEARARAAACAEVMRLPFREKIWRGAAGEFAGAGTGSSMDFQDHRTYVPGDDPRHINWAAYARTGQYSMKLYREEVRPLVDLVFDVSASMFFQEDKGARAIELFCFCAESARREGASLAAYVVKGDATLRLEDGAAHGDRWAEDAEALASTDPKAAPAVLAIPFRPGAMRIFISDLLYPVAPEGILGALSERDGRGLVMAPYTKAEAEAQWDGNYEFVDAEDGSNHFRRVSEPLLKRYRQAYTRHFDLWGSLGRKHDTRLVRVPADTPLEKALAGSGVTSMSI